MIEFLGKIWSKNVILSLFGSKHVILAHFGSKKVVLVIFSHLYSISNIFVTYLQNHHVLFIILVQYVRKTHFQHDRLFNDARLPKPDKNDGLQGNRAEISRRERLDLRADADPQAETGG